MNYIEMLARPTVCGWLEPSNVCHTCDCMHGGCVRTNWHWLVSVRYRQSMVISNNDANGVSIVLAANGQTIDGDGRYLTKRAMAVMRSSCWPLVHSLQTNAMALDDEDAIARVPMCFVNIHVAADEQITAGMMAV